MVEGCIYTSFSIDLSHVFNVYYIVPYLLFQLVCLSFYPLIRRSTTRTFVDVQIIRTSLISHLIVQVVCLFSGGIYEANLLKLYQRNIFFYRRYFSI